MSTSTSAHEFVAPSTTDHRSPCPALNALANHGYLPHDGRDITFTQAVHVMKEVYNISYPLGMFLTIGGMLLCGQWWRLPWKFDLHELAKHDMIEHNCSLTRSDTERDNVYAPVAVDPKLLQQLLNTTTHDTLNIADFTQARITRAEQDEKPLNGLHREIAHGEVVLTLRVLGIVPKKAHNAMGVCPNVVPRSFIQQWFGEDRLPIGWTKPEKPVGLWEIRGLSKSFAHQIWLRDPIARCA